MNATVIGRGPAGLSLAAALVAEGVETRLVGPGPGSNRPFANNYGAWSDELRALGLSHVADEAYAETEIRLDERRRHLLPFGYTRVNNHKLQDHLSRQFSERGGVIVEAEVRSVRSTERGVAIELDDGQRWSSPLVVDATGHRPRFARRAESFAGAAQVAYGRHLRVRAHPFPLDRMLLMDFSPLAACEEPPTTFLYAMPISRDRIFVEETSLSARPPLSLSVLESRLDQRLHQLDIEVLDELEVERCFIPMGGPLPPRHQTLFAFGAAASMVHPATGYQLTRTLRAAPRVARAVRRAQDAGRPLAPAAWSALWSRQDRASYALLRRGLEVLLSLEPSALRDFFGAFYARPPEEWDAYLRGDGSPLELARVMKGVFQDLPWALRARVALGVLRAPRDVRLSEE